MTQLFGLNLRKVRRMMESNNPLSRNYTDISDEDLDNLVREILTLDKILGDFFYYRPINIFSKYYFIFQYIIFLKNCFVKGFARLTGCQLERGVRVT